MISTSSLDALKTQIDIVDIISNYVELKKAGVNFKACCPFHHETSPSFVVSPAKQICHCFGCGAGGDSIKFVQEFKKLEFAEAVEEIANTMNFTLTYDSTSSAKDYSKIMEHTNAFFLSQLGEETRGYLNSRGVSDESIAAFEIGYSGSSKEQVSELNKNLFNTQEAIECGVLAVDEKAKTYARLNSRITFPIRNHRGKLIGFGGRITKGEGAKYINSPQTPLFDKSSNLYGHHLAKEHIYKKGTFVITEGYLDVVMFHQALIQTAVATMGTALTEQHCNIIKKAQAQVLLCFDGDTPGINAALKASKLLSAHGIHGGVIIFPEGKDPADMVKEGKIEELYAIMKQSTPLIKFVITQIASGHNINVPAQKQEALKHVGEYLRTLSPMLQDEYKPFVAKVLQVNAQHIPTHEASVQHTPMRRARLINIAEMNIIKSAAEHEELFNIVLDYADREIFEHHVQEFDMLLAGDEALPGLLLHDKLSIYTDRELVKQIKIMSIHHCYKKLSAAAHNEQSFEHKVAEIKKIKQKIKSLASEIAVSA
ncbi:MAG: DNA primase [Campylobacterales bacterium]|nr:DNA primase [Campylobacterales bacterium]